MAAFRICAALGCRLILQCDYARRWFVVSKNKHVFNEHPKQKAGGVNNAVQEHGLTDKLVSLALHGRTEDMVDAAQYLAKLSGYEHQAILLYHKARHLTLGARVLSHLPLLLLLFAFRTR